MPGVRRNQLDFTYLWSDVNVNTYAATTKEPMTTVDEVLTHLTALARPDQRSQLCQKGSQLGTAPYRQTQRHAAPICHRGSG